MKVFEKIVFRSLFPWRVLCTCIVLGIFILASIIEELILTPRIMEKNVGINPVIITLSVSVWSYLLGIPGLLLAVPMTGLMIVSFKKYFSNAYKDVFIG